MYDLTEKLAVFFNSGKTEKEREELCRKIWDKYHKRLLYFIRSYSREESEDLLQEIFLKVFNNLEKYNPFYSFKVWIYTIAKNHCINYLKKNRKEITLLGDASLLIDNNRSRPVENELIEKQQEQQLQLFLSQLPSDIQTTCYLRFSEKLKYKHIARILDIPVGTVKSRIHQVKSDLKSLLEEKDEYSE